MPHYDVVNAAYKALPLLPAKQRVRFAYNLLAHCNDANLQSTNDAEKADLKASPLLPSKQREPFARYFLARPTDDKPSSDFLTTDMIGIVGMLPAEEYPAILHKMKEISKDSTGHYTETSTQDILRAGFTLLPSSFHEGLAKEIIQLHRKSTTNTTDKRTVRQDLDWGKLDEKFKVPDQYATYIAAELIDFYKGTNRDAAHIARIILRAIARPVPLSVVNPLIDMMIDEVNEKNQNKNLYEPHLLDEFCYIRHIIEATDHPAFDQKTTKFWAQKYRAGEVSAHAFTAAHKYQNRSFSAYDDESVSMTPLSVKEHPYPCIVFKAAATGEAKEPQVSVSGQTPAPLSEVLRRVSQWHEPHRAAQQEIQQILAPYYAPKVLKC